MDSISAFRQIVTSDGPRRHILYSEIQSEEKKKWPQSGHVTGRPTLGVTVRGLYPSEKEARGVACGLLVDAVQAGSDAADKVQAGDILLTANGTELNTTDDLLAVRDALDVGESILFQADREGACLEYSVRLVEQYELNQ